jgi:hypothetical protein
MKNIIDICKDFGLEIPADKEAAFNKAVSENYKTIAEHEKKVTRLTDDLAAEKKRADDAVETLKGFEGKDFDAITKERDEWKRKHDDAVAEYARQQEDREFNHALENAISDAKGKNHKAIMALLDVEKLRGSKNRDKDIKEAIESLRTDSGYLFGDNGGGAAFTDRNGNGGAGGGTVTIKDIMSIKDPVERQSKIMQNIQLFKKGSNE